MARKTYEAVCTCSINSKANISLWYNYENLHVFLPLKSASAKDCHPSDSTEGTLSLVEVTSMLTLPVNKGPLNAPQVMVNNKVMCFCELFSLMLLLGAISLGCTFDQELVVAFVQLHLLIFVAIYF